MLIWLIYKNSLETMGRDLSTSVWMCSDYRAMPKRDVNTAGDIHATELSRVAYGR
jgi:hypothetical protein